MVDKLAHLLVCRDHDCAIVENFDWYIRENWVGSKQRASYTNLP